jgi:F-box/WD-40 domain protein 7
MELMSDPVMVATGHTYDRQCIAKWLAQGNRTCPVTGMRLRHLELVPNHALRNAIQVGFSMSPGHGTEVEALASTVLGEPAMQAQLLQ